MIKVVSSYQTNAHTVLILSEDVPLIPFKEISIEGVSYTPEVVYDADNEIAIASIGEFEGKTIEFI